MAMAKSFTFAEPPTVIGVNAGTAPGTLSVPLLLIEVGPVDGAVTVTVTGAGGVFPNNLTVSASYPYQFFAPGILMLGNTITLTTQTVMRHE